MSRTAFVAGLLLLLAPALHAEDKAGTAAYRDGLDALESGKFADAATALGKAVAADDENADYHTARAVALTLSEKFPQAIKELERSLKLRPGHRETRLWLAVAYRMNGEPAKGSMHFTHGQEVPADYATFVYSEMAMDYWRGVVMKQGGKTGRDLFARAGAWYARRAKGGSGPAIRADLLARARLRVRNGEHAAALSDLEAVRGQMGDEIEFLNLHGWCLVMTGDAETGRWQFTRALTKDTTLADAYLGRALAAARMGDSRRSRSDLAVATRLAPKEAAAFTAKAKKWLDVEPAGAPAALLEKLRKQAAKDEFADLVRLAARLHRANEARRRRYDEAHQDQLRKLEDGARERPRDPARLAALAAFLYRGAIVPRERVEPRGPYHLYRPQTPAVQAQELARAEKLCDQALALDRKHPQALVTKVALLAWQTRFEQARPYLEALVALGAPDDPEVARQLIALVEVDASRRRGMASSLRSDTLVNREETSTLIIYTWRSPTQEELRRAAELDRQADRLLKIGLAYLDTAARKNADTVGGLLCQAALARRKKDHESARAALEKAVRLDPSLAEAHEQLAGVYEALGKPAEATEARVRAVTLLQTTAAPRLKLAWSQASRTRWKSAREELAKALELDPSDARGLAYLGVVNAAEDKPDEAVGCFRAALALEEARARAAGTTYLAGGKGAVYPEDVGLTLGVRLRLGQLLLSRKKYADAAAVLRDSAALQARTDPRALAADVPSALLPDPRLEPTDVPQSEIFASLLAWSRLEAGRALVGQGKRAEGARDFEAAVALSKARELSTCPNRGRIEEPRAWAALALAQLHLSAGDRETARKWLYESVSFSKEAEAERKRLQQALRGQR